MKRKFSEMSHSSNSTVLEENTNIENQMISKKKEGIKEEMIKTYCRIRPLPENSTGIYN